VLLFASVIVVWHTMSEWKKVDACLDAGGSFDDHQGVCDMVRSHRRPSSGGLGERGLVLAAGSGIVGLSLLFRRGRTK